MIEMKNQDYYEFLQISPNADSDTIHRVYRFLAAASIRTTRSPAIRKSSSC